MRPTIARIVTGIRKHREELHSQGARVKTRGLYTVEGAAATSSSSSSTSSRGFYGITSAALCLPLHPGKIMSQGRQEFAMLLPGTGNGGNVSALIGIRWHERSPSAARLSSIRPSQVEDRVLIRLVPLHRSSFSCRLQLRFDKSGNSLGWRGGVKTGRIEKFLYELFKLDINSCARERRIYSIWFLSRHDVAENWTAKRCLNLIQQFAKISSPRLI